MRLMPHARSETATKVGSLVALLAIELAVFTVLSPDFLTSSNLFNVMALDTENGIIALGMALVIASGGIDLSVGSILALSSVTMGYAVQHGQSVAVAAVICLATGLVCGLINGVLVVALRLHPLLVTLGTLALYRGLALGISNGNGFSGFPQSFEYFGQTYIGPVPAQVVVWLLLALAVYGVVNATPAGRRLLAVGINEVAASFAGIRVGGGPAGGVRQQRPAHRGRQHHLLVPGVQRPRRLRHRPRTPGHRGRRGRRGEHRGGEISAARTTLAVIVIGVIPDGLRLQASIPAGST